MQQALTQDATTPTVQGSIVYPALDNTNLATWVPDEQELRGCHARVGDTLGFPFDGDDTVIGAVLLINPKDGASPPSPFAEGGSVTLKFSEADALFVTPVLAYKGLFCFSIAFTTQNKVTGEYKPYILPDPELEVGSIGDPDQPLAA